MDVAFGIVAHVDQVSRHFELLPRETRQWVGNTYFIDEPRFRCASFPDSAVTIHDLSDGLRNHLPNSWHSTDWKYALFEEGLLDRYQFALCAESDERLAYSDYEKPDDFEHRFGSLLDSLEMWAVVFAWESEFIDDEFRFSVNETVQHLRTTFQRQFRSSEPTRGFIAVSLTAQ